jgi:transcriptional regulator with XRE-family HTH domain
MSTDPTLSARVADEVRAMIYRKNLNKSELARRLGVSHTWVTNRLAGHQQIGLDELERIADALDVEVADLLPAPAKREIRYSTQPATRPTPPGRTGDPHRVRATAKPSGHHRAGRPAWTHAGVTR